MTTSVAGWRVFGRAARAGSALRLVMTWRIPVSENSVSVAVSVCMSVRVNVAVVVVALASSSWW